MYLRTDGKFAASAAQDDGVIRLADTVGRAEEPDRDAGCGLLERPGRTS